MYGARLSTKKRAEQNKTNSFISAFRNTAEAARKKLKKEKTHSRMFHQVFFFSMPSNAITQT